MTTTTHKTIMVLLSAIWLAISVGDARADASADALRGRVEEELLSDGISLARLGQRLELRTNGTSLEVVIADAASGKVLASRAVDRLPADQAAAVAQLTVVVSDLLRERGLAPAAGGPGASGGWAATFAPAAVVAYHRPTSVAVVAVARPGRTGDETRAAAAALLAAYRSAGVATVVDGSSLGEVSEAEDAAIVARAAALSVDKVAIVRAFVEGPSVRAIVTLYGANNQLVTGFSAVAGQALAAPATGPASDGSVADQIMRTKTEPADKDGVVRLWVQPNDTKIQLLRTQLTHVTASNGATGTLGFSDIVCRAPCGVVVDGSLGETFTFGDEQVPLTDRFQLIGHKGDVTARVKLGRPYLRQAAWFAGIFAISGLTMGSISAFSSSESIHDDTITAVGLGGGGALLVGAIVMYVASSPDVSFTTGRPK